MPGGGLCFCACDSDSDNSSVYVNRPSSLKKRGKGTAAIATGLQVAKKSPPSSVREKTTTPSSTPEKTGTLQQEQQQQQQSSSPHTTTTTTRATTVTQPKKTRPSPTRSRRSTMHRKVAPHEEFIDYSSSTAVERLARDVETVLRSWHVVDGSDRHASLRVKPKDFTSPKRDGSPQSGNPNHILSPRLSPQPAAQPPLLMPPHQSVQLLRSEHLAWQMSFYLPENGGQQQIVESIDLEIALWEGDGHCAMDEEEHESSLPLSLRRPTGLAKMPMDVFSNFSTLFGIGQHLTLTPLDVRLGPELWTFLSNSIQQRHDSTTARSAVTTVLSGWLQSALNLATLSCRCYLPAFGVWGPYQPQKRNDSASILPAWLQVPQEQLQLSPIRNRRRFQKPPLHLNRHYIPPVLTGQCLTSTLSTTPDDDNEDSKQVVFWAALLPHVTNARLGTDSRLTVWGDVLLRHCTGSTVALWGARHVYSWTRPTPTTQYTVLFMDDDDDWDDKIWRMRPNPDVTLIANPDDESVVAHAYRRACQQYALKLLEEASGTSADDPLWGPVQDPLASIHATVTWNATTLCTGDEQDLQPLLTLPLKIRSRQVMSRMDWIEAEEAIEHSILDPYRPGVFVVQVHGDAESAQATLTATQRCVLAALIRTATLPAETMLSHLLDEQLMDRWDTKAGNDTATQLASRIQAQPGTLALVEAMDWEHATDDMIDLHVAEEIVARVFEGEIMIGYPERPEGHIGPIGPDVDELFKPIPKSAPFGRLVSNLMVHMANVRSPSSIVLVFSTFCQELRRRWDARESLPNMGFVTGLDPSPDSYAPKRCFSNVGEKASFAAQVNCSEPDPDDWNCLVGQKLQVYNLCIETAIAEELRKMEIVEKRRLSDGATFHTPAKAVERPAQKPRLGNSPSKDSHGNPLTEGDSRKSGRNSVGGLLNGDVRPQGDDSEAETIRNERDSAAAESKSVDADYLSVASSMGIEEIPSATTVLNDNTGAVYLEQTVAHHAAMSPIRAKTKSLMSGSIEISANNERSERGDDSSRGSRTASKSAMDEGSKSVASQQSSYYDADEGGAVPSLLQMIMGHSAERSAAASVLGIIMGNDRNAERKGARCPVLGATLQNGEQVYAPYLRRPSPLTDDVIIQRRLMLSRQKGQKIAAVSALEQLEMAHRFQLPKLSADMSAFKAANPWASFEDFTSWYGSPVNPLEEYEEARSQDIRLGVVSDDTVETSIAKTSESAILLEITKQFWESTWESALPKAASENEPLFDPLSTVEMALDYLETLHPATLMCNVLAVNLSSAYFGLVFSADEAIEIASIRASLRRLRKRIEVAVNLLSLDAVTSGQVSNPLHPGLSSIEAMTACENACIVLAENEVLLARGRSLLSKFPGKFELIDRILRASEGSLISVTNEAEQRDVLRTVLSQQTDPTSRSSRPSPTLREYLLRNDDGSYPCQLCVRYGNHVKDLNSEGGLLMAIARTQPETNSLAI